MADKPSSFSSIMANLEWMITFAYFVGGLSGGLLGFSFVPLPRILEESVSDDCAAGLSEFKLTIMYAFISLCSVMISLIWMGCIKMVLSHRFREEIDAKMSQQNAVSRAIRCALLFSQAILVAGFVSSSLSTYYSVQMKSIKFGCMGVGAQIGLVGFMTVLVISVIVKLFLIYRMTFVEFDEFHIQ